MASFQINRGLESNLPQEIIDGKIYFCTDTGNLFIDYESSRIHVNANKAQILSYLDEETGEYIDINAQDIFECINNASSAYVQPEEPTDAPEGALWVDTDANGVKITVNGVAPDENGNIEIEVGTDITINGISPDENGNIEIPAAQSDWNQNDINNPSYIHNRTHWIDGENVHQLDEKFIPMEIARVADIPAAIINTEAAVGQTIRIKNVSDDKPIEWEAVDFPETDLSNYYTKNEIDGLLYEYITAVDAIIG